MDDTDPMSQIDESLQLLPHRGEATGLHLDQQVPSDQIDDVAVDRDLDAISWLRIPGLQRSVERPLAEQPDSRRIISHVTDPKAVLAPFPVKARTSLRFGEVPWWTIPH